MAGGEVCFQIFGSVQIDPRIEPPLDLPLSTVQDCCYAVPALAQSSGSDYYKNDFFGAITFADRGTIAIDIFLEKFQNGWVEQTQLDSNAYGKHYPLANTRVNDDSEKYSGYYISWQQVLNNFGEGTYRIRFDQTTLFGVVSSYSFEFCARYYTNERANETIRFDHSMNGYVGSLTDDRYRNDFGKLGWFSQLRIGGWFGNNSSSYTRDFVRYQNGKQVWVQDEQIQNYILKTERLPAYLHDYIRVRILQSDDLEITDYNKNNPNVHQRRAVIVDSDYEPVWNYMTKLSSVELKFKQAYQNLIKKRC